MIDSPVLRGRFAEDQQYQTAVDLAIFVGHQGCDSHARQTATHVSQSPFFSSSNNMVVLVSIESLDTLVALGRAM